MYLRVYRMFSLGARLDLNIWWKYIDFVSAVTTAGKLEPPKKTTREFRFWKQLFTNVQNRKKSKGLNQVIKQSSKLI